MKFKNNFGFSLRILLILYLLKIIINSCDRETPILYGGNCESLFCSVDQYSSGECEINNDIIKTQWLNNPIFIGNEYSSYFTYGKYSNGDIIIYIQDDAVSPNRVFYGLQKNGRPLFTDSNNDETPYKYMNAEIGNSQQIPHEVCIITTNSDKKEYVLIIGKEGNYFELYDFENNKIYKKKVVEFIGSEIYNSFGFSLNKQEENNDYYFLLGSLIYNSDSQTNRKNTYTLILQKFVFNSKESLENDSNILIYTSLQLIDMVNMVSCFETSLKNIVCFYSNATKIDNTWYYKYFIIAYDNNLLEKNIVQEISSIDTYVQIFLKCLHYK